MKLKITVFMTLLGLSPWLNAQQPLDRHKCFGRATLPDQLIDGDIPVEYCLESISVDPDDRQINISSKITPQVFSDMKINSLLRSQDGKVRFYASKEIFSDWNSDCNEGQTVTLVITGQTDTKGNIAINDNLKIITDDKTTTDTCKVQPTMTTYRYNLK